MKTERLRRLLRLPSRRIEEDLDAEIAYHLESTEQELRARGLTPEAARQAARARFGDVAATRRSLAREDRSFAREEKAREWVGDILRDTKHVIRGLVREPGFSLAVIFTLALALGANATMFGMIDRLLLRPAPMIPNDERLSLVYFTRETTEWGKVTSTSISYPALEDLRSVRDAVADVAAWFPIELSLGRGREARNVKATLVTPNYMGLLSVAPIAGRGFTTTEWDDASGNPAIVRESLATELFGSVEAAIGNALVLNDIRFTVVGVSPNAFNTPRSERTDVFVPFASLGASQISEDWRTTRNSHWLRLVARLAPGVTRPQVNDALTRVFRAAQIAAGKKQSDWQVIAGSIVNARRPSGLGESRLALWLGGVALAVLIIACANVANLLLARGTKRQGEIALRLAIGGSRGRLVRYLLGESLVLAAVGGALGLLIARWGGSLMRTTLLSELAWEESPVDFRVALFTLGAIVLTAVLAGLVPSLNASRLDLTSALKTGARAGARRSGLRSTLVMVQAALSVTLLIGAGLFLSSLTRALRLDVGFDVERLLLAQPSLGSGMAGITPTDTAALTARREVVWKEAADRVRTIPGVNAVSQTVTSPYESQWVDDIFLPGKGALPAIKGGGPYMNGVSWEYLATVGSRITRGRSFNERDVEGGPLVAVINEAMARAVWPGEEALGKCFHRGADSMPCTTVVGVLADARVTSFKEAPAPQYYLPLTQWRPDMRSLIIRSEGKPEALSQPVRRALQELYGGLPYVNVRSLREVMQPEMRTWRLGATMFAIFGVLALVVAAIGTYSVVSYDVTQRRREIGVRLALGSGRGAVARLVVRDGAQRALAGVGIGSVVAYFATPFLRDLLFETSVREPTVFVSVAFVLISAAVLASAVPAFVATRVAPMEALRE